MTGSGADGSPGAAARPGSDLKLLTTADLDDVRVGVEDAERLRRERENVERRLHDAELLEKVRAQGPDGTAYAIVFNELYDYGWSLLDAWVKTGLIFAKVKAVARGVSASQASRDILYDNVGGARDDIVANTLHAALRVFMEEAVLAGGWRLDGGATLTTYFTTRALYEFPNVFRSWERNEDRCNPDRLAREGMALTDEERDVRMSNLPEQQVIDHDGLMERLNQVKAGRQREIVALDALDFTDAEIMEICGAVSTKAVRGVLERYRTSQRKAASE